MKLIVLMLTLISLAGCASSLKVYDSKNSEAKGVPVNAPQLVEITTVTNFKVAKGRENYKDFCTSETSSRFEVLPLGERFYITFEPANLGDGEFAVEFTDKGLLKSVTLNSEASSGAEQATALLSSVLPFITSPKQVSVPPPLIEPDETAQKLKAKHCLKAGSKVVSIKKIEVQ